MQERGDTRSNKEDRQKFFEIDCKQEEIQDRMEKIEKKSSRSTASKRRSRSNGEDRQKFLEIDCKQEEIQDRMKKIDKNFLRSNATIKRYKIDCRRSNHKS